MLGDKPAATTLAVTDLDRAKTFYKDTLGLKALPGPDEGIAFFEAGEGARIALYQRETPPKTDVTAIGFDVKNIEEVVGGLKSKGVTFENYDMGELKTVDGIASQGNWKAAWFKDPDGNILSINQM